MTITEKYNIKKKTDDKQVNKLKGLKENIT